MIICVDTGGTKTLVSSFDHAGQVGESFRFPTPQDFEAYLDELASTIKKHYILLEVEAIVIGIPGAIKDNVILWCANLPWENLNLASRLSEKLHFVKPIYLENDASLAGLAEAHSIEPVPTVCLYVTISTGIGTGLIIDGDIIPDIATEGGHMVVEYNGNVLQWETLASGRAIFTTYGAFAKDISNPTIWREIADKISRGLLDMIPMLLPDVIVIGGSVGTYFDKYGAFLTENIEQKLYPHIKRPKIIQASHPEEAVIYGGYRYGIDSLTR